MKLLNPTNRTLIMTVSVQRFLYSNVPLSEVILVRLLELLRMTVAKGMVSPDSEEMTVPFKLKLQLVWARPEL